MQEVEEGQVFGVVRMGWREGLEHPPEVAVMQTCWKEGEERGFLQNGVRIEIVLQILILHQIPQRKQGRSRGTRA